MTFLRKEEVFEQICSASLNGTLGLFAGSGLTKALLADSHEYSSYTWSELLEKCCAQMNVEPDILKSRGSFPEIASMICKQHSINENKSIEESISLLKTTIARIPLIDGFGSLFRTPKML